MEAAPPEKPSLLRWLLTGFGPGPGEPSPKWTKKQLGDEKPKKIAVKCDMCKGISGGPACVRACPTGAAIRVSPEEFLSLARLDEDTDCWRARSDEHTSELKSLMRISSGACCLNNKN